MLFYSITILLRFGVSYTNQKIQYVHSFRLLSSCFFVHFDLGKLFFFLLWFCFLAFTFSYAFFYTLGWFIFVSAVLLTLTLACWLVRGCYYKYVHCACVYLFSFKTPVIDWSHARISMEHNTQHLSHICFRTQQHQIDEKSKNKSRM